MHGLDTVEHHDIANRLFPFYPVIGCGKHLPVMKIKGLTN
jgi:hypothetical protein